MEKKKKKRKKINVTRCFGMAKIICWAQTREKDEEADRRKGEKMLFENKLACLLPSDRTKLTTERDGK